MFIALMYSWPFAWMFTVVAVLSFVRYCMYRQDKKERDKQIIRTPADVARLNLVRDSRENA